MTDDPYGEGAPQGAGRWDPLPQGDYDDGATAFVKLPEGGIDALLSGDSPLAAPGHGYVPPRITAESGEGAEGTAAAPGDAWPAPGGRWPDPNAVPPHGQGADDRFTYQPAATQQWTYEEPAAPPASGHDVTGQWSIPVAGGDLPDESGEFTTSSLVEQWGGGTPPATLPGGAPAPWATDGAGRPWGEPPREPGAEDRQQDAATPPADGPAHPGDRSPLPAGAPAPTDAYPSGGRTYGDGLAANGQGPADGFPAGAPGRPGEFPAHGAGTADPHSADGRTHGAGLPVDASGHPGGRSAAGAGTAAAHGSAYADAPAAGDPAHTGSHPADGPSGAPAGTYAGGPEDSGRPAPASEPVARRAGADGHGPAQGPGASDGAPAAHTPDEATGPAAQAGTRPVTAGATASAGQTTATGPTDEHAAADGTDGSGVPTDADHPAATGEDAAADGPEAEDAAPLPPHDDHPLASYVLRVNGGDRPVTDAWIGESLLYVLRERLGLAGAKDGCSQGECGACNVQVDGRLVASCLVPAVTAAGSEVRTVEGLAVDGQSSDVQRALARCGAVQCGFCVPGMAMTLHDLLEGNPAPTELETRQALCGNLCRCTGYRGVLEAVKEVVAERETQTGADTESDGDEARIPHQAGPGSGGVNPSAFETPGVFDPPGGFTAPGTIPGPAQGHGPAQGPGQGPHEQTYGQDGGQA